MKLSRLSNRQLRRLLARGEVRFANSMPWKYAYKDLLMKYDKYQSEALSATKKMKEIQEAISELAKKNKNKKVESLARENYADLGNWERQLFEIRKDLGRIKYMPDTE